MSVYFSYFPKGVHTERLVTDITRRVDFRQTTLADPYAFHPYQIVGDDRAEDIARYYYGSVEYTWLVWLSNKVIDPYYEWPMSYTNFIRYLKKKYETQSGTTGQGVIEWTQNEQITSNIINYRNIEDPEITITPKTWELKTDIVAEEWEPIRYYRYEDEINNDRRLIQLIDDRYTRIILKEIKELLNDGAS